MGGNFHTSAQDIVLKDGHKLKCELKNNSGRTVSASLDLNHYVGNTDGWFKWNGRDFTRSAKNISLVHGDGGPKLEADLLCADGSYRARQGLHIADRIENRNGELVFLHD
ncbi:Cyanovirin-N [Tricharina praecox]|uniref:Cyanovirin-N n=1 Tax=Tricharina praecox TaxID=43433 RepID=UPI00221E5089|nr:Cyanovirin-N [Tricharina praecox]KAI5857840.1 Cyanovirin-N [Tricharina praecox]